MEDFDCKRKRYENGVPIIFIIICLLKYNFHSFKKFIIYIFHFSGLLDLRKKDSSQITDEELINFLSSIYNKKIDKKSFYKLMDCSKNTFNKHFKEYFELKGYVNRRRFTLLEVYGILKELQGEGNWGMMELIKKERLAKIIHNGNLKKLADEYILFIQKDVSNGKDVYKSKDSFSPREVKLYLEHIGLSESKIVEKLFRYDKLKEISLLIFGVLILVAASKEYTHLSQ